MRRLKLLLCGLFLAVTLVACGQKGPLYLPDGGTGAVPELEPDDDREADGPQA